jgi:hypothetical protein
VQFHVTGLLNKLGADSRAQAVAIAAQRGQLRTAAAVPESATAPSVILVPAPDQCRTGSGRKQVPVETTAVNAAGTAHLIPHARCAPGYP